jgi:CheY-like chemotaxis protein
MADNKKLDPQVIKERVGKHLRTADEFTRFQRFDEAMLEIERALELDPKNNYARSFLERVKLMQKRSHQKEIDDSVPAELSLEDRMAQIAVHLSAAEELINKREYKRALEEVARVYKIDPKNYYAQAYSERIDTLLLEENAEGVKLFKNIMQPGKPVPVQTSHPERGSTLMYRELLKNVWMDGKVTEEEAQELAAMRDLFGITMDDHEIMEHGIKIDAYLEALRIAWRDGTLTDIEQKALQVMREKYAISAEDQAIAEKRFDEIKKAAKSRGTILIVDAERETLVALGKALKHKGYTVFMAQKVEDAFQILINQIPNLIVSEMLFPNSTMDGVGFFQKLREHPVLKHTPFFFISSITDKKVIQVSYRLGADHFLAKPIDIDILLAMIDGKLHNSL